MTQPLVSIVVSNLNGEKFLGPCLDWVFKQDYTNIEVIMVDNGSRDKSVALVKNKFPQVKVIELEKDLGSAYAQNMACSVAQGKYYCNLNNDVLIPEDTLARMVDELERDPNCVVNVAEVDWEGSYARTGLPYSWPALRILSRLFGGLVGEGEPFYPSLSFCLLPRELLLRVPFNEHFFFYEDVEWGWRLRLLNVSLKFLNDSFVYHKGAGSVGGSPGLSSYRAFLRARNTLASHFICLKIPAWLFFLPVLFFFYLADFVWYLRKISVLKAYLNGLFDFFRKLPLFIQDRRKVQGERVVGDMTLIRAIIGSIGYHARERRSILTTERRPRPVID